jgi:hypothetical protein
LENPDGNELNQHYRRYQLKKIKRVSAERERDKPDKVVKGKQVRNEAEKGHRVDRRMRKEGLIAGNIIPDRPKMYEEKPLEKVRHSDRKKTTVVSYKV